MSGIANVMCWTFISETTVSDEIKEILVENENVIVAYKTIRDVAAISSKRIIIADKQGITGKKVEIYSIPFKSIIMYSSENAGAIDLNSELELWTRAGKFKLCLGRGVNIRKLDKIIANHIL